MPPVRNASGTDYSLLQSWLGIEPGPWPVDHYALLGLAPSSCDPVEIERVVLARMDRIRPHQLLHPELVTEGMNRLAQALICLTDPAARAMYDTELGIVEPKSASGFSQRNAGEKNHLRGGSGHEPAFEPIPGFPISTDEPEQTGTDVTQVLDVRYVPGLAPPEPLPPAYEVIEEETPSPLPPAYEIVGEDESGRSGAAFKIVEAKVISRPEPLWQPPTRRALFTRLVAIRRLLAMWQKLKPLLGNPREPIDRPVQVLALLETAAEVNPLLETVPGIVGKLSQSGGLVATLLRQPLVLHTIRSLLPDQRRAVAADWHRAESELISESSRLRELVRSGRPFSGRFRTRSRLGQLTRWMSRTPEAILLILAVAILFTALLRSSPAR